MTDDEDGSGDPSSLYNHIMDQWDSTAVGRQLFFLYLQNATEITSYVLGQYNEHDAVSADGVTKGNGFTLDRSISTSGSISPEQWEEDESYPEADFLSATSDYAYDNSTGNATGNTSNSINSTSSRNNSSPYLMPWPQRSAWIAIFTFLVIVAAVGNSLVAWIVFAHKRMKTVTNYFLVNLSLADLTMSVFNCIFNFTFMLNSHWPFGGFYCTVNNFVANISVAASVFTLVAISFDRYIAIVYPLRPRMGKSTARIAISLIWCASCILAIPCLLYSQTISHSYPDGEIRVICIVVWPDGMPSVSQQDFIYNIVFTVSTYLIPVIVMGACYSRMSYVLWRSKSIGELNQRQSESIQSKRKVVRMFMVVVTLFVICWLPYHGYFVYQFIDDQVISYKHVQHIFLSFYWLAMANTMINPLVYYYMNARFREHFRTVLCCRRPSPASMSSIGGASVVITRAGQRINGPLRNDRADFVTGPRQPRQVMHLRQYVSSVQSNGISVASDVTELPVEDSVRSNSENCQRHSNVGKSGPVLLDSHHQHVVVPGDAANTGTATWISSHGHLVTVWTPSLLPQTTTPPTVHDNTRSMNRINARITSRNSCDDVCDEATKDHQPVEETNKT